MMPTATTEPPMDSHFLRPLFFCSTGGPYCGAGEAEYTIVGIAAEDITYPDYMADDDLCSTVVDTEVVLWFGADADPGTAYCAAGL